jgi:putative addiction module CopG family antidote
MTIEIPSEYQQFVREMIGSGTYHTEAEVVGEALQLLKDRQERLEHLRQDIQPALERLDRGEGIELDDQSLDQFFEDIKTRGRRRIEERRDVK